MAGDGTRWDDYLFVVIPGIGGSRLVRQVGGDRQLIWGRPRHVVGRVLSPLLLQVADDDGVQPAGVITSDWQIMNRPVVHGYGDLVRSIANVTHLRIDWCETTTPDDSARVVAFAYDFRRGIVHAADRLHDEVDRRLAALYPNPDDRRRRVVLCCHSMGGLVAREWARRDGPREWCKALVTLGTPNKGAPKALHVMSDGLTVRGIRVARRLSKVIQDWQSVYDLLPTYPMVESSAVKKRPSELDVSWLEPERVSSSFSTHQQITDSWVSLGGDAPSITTVGGVGKRTLHAASLSGDRLTMSRDPFLENSLLGDGTVPSESLMPYELDNSRGIAGLESAIGVGHGALVDWDRLSNELQRVVLARPSGLFLGGDSTSVVADIDEVGAAGSPVLVGAQVWSTSDTDLLPRPLVSDDITAMEVTVATNDAAGTWVRMDRTDQHGWVAELPPLQPGEYVVRVRATTASGSDPRQSVDAVVAVDLEQTERYDESTEGE